jgi:hypothetical protein
MSSKLREALEKFSAVDLSRLKFPLDGDSSAIYNSDKNEITIPYWMVAELLNEVKVAQDMAKSALKIPLRNCDVGTAVEQSKRFNEFCHNYMVKDGCKDCRILNMRGQCQFNWAQLPYREVK